MSFLCSKHMWVRSLLPVILTTITLWLGWIPYHAQIAIAAGENFDVADLSNVDNPIPITDPFGTGIELPDWNRISFGNLPNLAEGGSLQYPQEVIDLLGYDPSRTWLPDTSITDFIKMGDLENSLMPQNFNLEQISGITNTTSNMTGIPHQILGEVNLAQFDLTQFQELGTLRDVVPNLEVTSLADMPPILTLAASKLSPLDAQGVFDNLNEGLLGSGQILRELGDVQLGQLLDNFPQLNGAQLGELGLETLSNFKLDSIPGLSETPLGELDNWQESFLGDVPNLEGVPLGQMPDGISETMFAMFARVDVPLDPTEQSRLRSLSGSYQAGFAVDCQQNCMHMELADVSAGSLQNTEFEQSAVPTGGMTPGRVIGMQWIGGQQKVDGGFGALKAVNGGLEPTGRHPYGSAFKQVVWKVDPAAGRVQTAMYFRICKRGIPDLGCTPYFLGPIPFLIYSEKQPIFLGVAEPSEDGRGIDGLAEISGLPGGDLLTGTTRPVAAPQPCPPGINESDCVMLNPLPSMSGAGIYSRFRRRRPGHDGVDIQTVAGSRGCQGTVVAPDDGVVIHAGGGYGGYANTVVIYHPHRQISTFMAHLCPNISVSKGQQVTRGQVVGQEGGWGGPGGAHRAGVYNTHVHFEVHAGADQTHGLDGVQVDPESYKFTNSPLQPVQDLFG